MHHYNTSSVRNQCLKIPQVRTTKYGIRSIKHRGAHIWNDIPLSLRSEYILKETFIKKLKINLLELY